MILLLVLFVLIGVALFGYEVGGAIGIVVFTVFIIWLIATILKKDSDEVKSRRTAHESIIGNKDGILSITKSIYRDFSNYGIYIDEPQKQIIFVNLISLKKNKYNFDEILECSVLEDGVTIQSGSIGRAIAGGIVGGGVGAVVGASSGISTPKALSLSVRIVTSNIQNALCEIPIIYSEISRDSYDYKQKMQFAQEIYATIISIINYSKK